MSIKSSCLALALAGACSIAAAETTPVSFVRITSTSGSAQHEPACLVARNAQELEELVQRHGAPAIPIPGALIADVHNHMVIGIFLGDRPSPGYGMAVQSVEQVNEQLVVTYQEYIPDKAAVHAAALMQLFEIIQTPQSRLPVVCKGLPVISIDEANRRSQSKQKTSSAP
ncbi:MAG: protease complex subunit PrcB family protein [Comamonas sp.]|jgi:hypothetical protein|nr:protease complex subunit PrcB family protein [Comamonas sp.]